MNPLVAVLLGGFAGLIGTAFLELRYGNAIAPNAATPRAQQVGYILGALAATNILLHGILGVLLFQAMR